MKHSKQSPILTVLLTLFIVLPSVAQDNAGPITISQELYIYHAKLKLDQVRKEQVKLARAKEVIQDNEFKSTGIETGIFLPDPLMLDGKPLDFGGFDILSIGELTVIKGASSPGESVKVPFYVYLIRNGEKVLIPGRETPDVTQLKIELSEILDHAEPGDLLVIEAVNAEDGAVKRILKILGAGC